MKVYHGSTVVVEHPSVSAGRDHLDFGKGFYLTTIREQAEKWAWQLSRRFPNAKPVLNIYELDAITDKYRILTFEGYNEAWLDFIVANRRGLGSWKAYDIVEGGIANDKVFDTIEIYMAGQITKEVAIGRLRYEQPNQQICILSQNLADEALHFIEHKTI